MAGIRPAKSAVKAKVAKVAESVTGGFRPGNVEKVHHGGEFKLGGGRVGGAAKPSRKPAAGQKEFDFEKTTTDPVSSVKKPASPEKPLPFVDHELPKYQANLGSTSRYNLSRASQNVAATPGKTPEKYLDELNSGIKEAVHSGDYYVRIPSSVLPKIIEDGRFKTQFETKTSMGHYAKGQKLRINAEETKLGIPRDTAPENRPVYGYLSGRDFSMIHGHQEGILSSYGDVSVKLKPHVRDRTTITFGDTLGLAGSAVRDSSPTHVGMIFRNLEPHHAIATDSNRSGPEKLTAILDHMTINTRKHKGKFGDKVNDYIEAQYHGGLRAEDIAEVAFTEEPSHETRSILAKHGIPHRVIPKP